MLKEKILPISILCFIVSAKIIASGMRDNGSNISSGLNNISQGLNGISNTIYSIKNQDNLISRKQIYNITDAANYLGISQFELESIVENKDSGIPYVKVNDKYIFNKDALDKWMSTARFETK